MHPTETGQLVPKIQAGKGCNFKIENKETVCFVWRYLKIASSGSVCLIISDMVLIKYGYPHPQTSRITLKGKKDNVEQ